MAAHWECSQDTMGLVEARMDASESVVAEPGRMIYKTESVRFDARLHSSRRGIGAKLRSAISRKIGGESALLASFAGPGRVGFAAPFPGSLRSITLPAGQSVLVQRGGFLCADGSVGFEIAWVRKLGAALFGGEGLMFQRLTGPGTAWVHACGSFTDFQLAAGETLLAGTGAVVALGESVDFSIERAGGPLTMLFGGQGMFLAKLTGPGPVALQSMSLRELQSSMQPPGGE